MENNNFDVIKQIQDTADIVQVVSKHIKLVPRGSNYFGLCPFHSDNNPSLVVSRKKKIFKCFVCGTKGNVFSFVQKYKKISFIDAVVDVAKTINFDLAKLNVQRNSSFDPKILRITNANKQAAEWYSGFLKNPENSNALKYLNDRGIGQKEIEYFNIGYAGKDKNLMTKMLMNADEMFGEKDKDQVWNEQELINAGISILNRNNEICDFFVDRIIFPIYDINSTLVGFSGRTISNNEVKYLNSATTKTFSKGNILYNLNNVKEQQDNRLLIVEGFFDAIAFFSAGLKNVVATMGVSLTINHINLLSSISGLKSIILSFDNDQAGDFATVENGKKLIENGFDVYVIQKNKNFKDMDEVLQKNGKDEVLKMYENRIDFLSFLIKNTFDKKISKDEITFETKKLIGEIIEYGDVLNKTRHLKFLSEISNINYEDISEKYEQIKKKENNNQLKKIIKTTEKSTMRVDETKVGAEGEWIKSQAKLNELSYNLMKSLDTLIIMMIIYPDSIDKIFDNFTQSRSYGNEDQLTLIKVIHLQYSRNSFSIEKLYEYLDAQIEKRENSIIYLNAKEHLERLLDDPTLFFLNKEMKKEIIDERVLNLLKKIRDFRYSVILLEHQIERSKLVLEDKEKNKIKIDILSKKIIDLNELRKKKLGKK